MKTSQQIKLHHTYKNASLFMAFVRKEFHHIFRDHTSMLILLVMPVLMLVLFGYALNTEVRNSKFAVYDPSNDVATNDIVERLQLDNYFKLVKRLNHPGDVQQVFNRGEVAMVVVFPDHFYENLSHEGSAQIQLMADGSDPNTATTITNYAGNIIAKYAAEKLGSSEAIKPMVIQPNVKLLYNPSLKAAYNFVPGVMGMIILLICAMMTSVSITREKERGTMEVLLVSPMKPIYVILSKTVPYFLLSAINLLTILLIAVFVMEVPIVGSLSLLIILSLLYIFVCLSFGILISSIVQTQLAAMVISAIGLMMPVMILSGMMFPIDNMPWILQRVSDIIPAKWYILAIKKIMIKGLSWDAVLVELSVLTGMAVVLIAISLKKFKKRLE